MASGLYQKYRQKALNPICNLFVTNATNATPIVVTTSKAHPFIDSNQVTINGVGGNTAANGTFYVDSLTSTTFALYSDSGLTTPVAGTGAYTSGGNVVLTDAQLKKFGYVVRWGSGSSGETYGDDIKALLVNITGTGTLYTPDLTADEFLSSIASGARIATSSVLVNKTNIQGTVGGTADADDVVFSLVPAGSAIEAFVLYKDTGDEATSPLIMYVDSASATGLPVTPNGGNITVSFDTGNNRIFVL